MSQREQSPFRTYAHWLDGEFLKQTSWGHDPIDPRWQQHVGEWEKRLKISLLFGFEFLLSDVQIVDSRLLLNLFSSEEFRRFVGRFPATMTLRSSPLAPTKEQVRSKAVLSGLERSLHREWISSTFPSPDPTRRVAELLLKADDVDTDLIVNSQEFRHVLDKTPPPFRRLLESIPYVCDHFLRTSRSFSLPPQLSGAPRSYFSVLLEARDKSSGEIQQEFSDVVTYIETRLEESDRFRRSRVKTLLDEEIGSKLDDRYRKVWHTAIDAWNVAVQEHIAGHAGGSISPLSHSPGVGLVLGIPTAAIDLHRAAGETLKELDIMRSTRFRFPDIGGLTWDRFAQLFEATEVTRAKLKESKVVVEDATEVDHRLEAHTKTLAREVMKLEMPSRGPSQWLDIGISLAALLGGGPVLAAAGGVKAGYQLSSSTLRALRRRELVKTLTRGGKRFLIDQSGDG